MVASPTECVDGDVLWRAAHESGYRLPVEFGGFTARLAVGSDRHGHCPWAAGGGGRERR